MFDLYARIITDNTSAQLDRTFTYKIPREFVKKAKTGMRVLIPFGMRNSLIEGIIIEITHELTEEERKYKIKSIAYFLEKIPVLNDKQLELMKWMRDEYLCRYIDVIRTMLPRGLSVKVNKVISLEKQIDEEGDIQAYINDRKKVSLKTLEQKFKEEHLKSVLNDLVNSGNILIQEAYEQEIKKSYVKKVYLNYENPKDILNVLTKNAVKQRAAVEYLAEKGGSAEMKELEEKAGAASSVIRTLVGRGYVRIEEEEEYRSPVKVDIDHYEKHMLNDEQQDAFDEIVYSDRRKFLLKGVTGSGKTEVYLQLIEENLKKGKNSIVLVPEISLTPQTMERFIGRFGDRVAVFHSKLTLGERYDEWRRMKRGEVDIVIGTRSAIFAPFDDIGLIVIDEEHENTYKSDQNPKYDTVQLAEKMTEIYGCKLVMGSATPAIEDFYKTETGDVKLLELKNRVKNISMPEIEIVDMGEELNNGNLTIFSRPLYNAINDRLEKKEQTILFLNSRGFAKSVKCRSCGYVVMCDSCDISMTYHEDKNRMVCHYCGETKPVPSVCPDCGSKYIKHLGIGTQKVEQQVLKHFPHARTARMDTDTMRKKGSYESVLDKVKSGEIDILIGTQMISKGLDYPNITLVGIIMADITLNIPGYTSAEKTYQLITQVAGRAGRSGKQGEVIVQTYSPGHYAIKAAEFTDYKQIYRDEIKMRREFRYPPFCDLIDITVSGSDENEALEFTELLSESMREEYEDSGFEHSEISHANSACIYKVRNRYRFKIMIKTDERERDFIKDMVRKHCIDRKRDENSDIIVSVDINPKFIL